MHPLSVTGKQWLVRDCDDRHALALAQRLNVPEIVGRLLAIRGIPLDTAAAFLNPRVREAMPDPFVLKDMDTAAGRIAAAIMAGEKVAVFGDYDVDGATSSALFKRYFAALGLPLDIYIPDRMTEGYGPTIPAMQTLHQRGNRLVITVDCGITAFAPLEKAQQLGLDVVVVDHHVGEPDLPAAVAVVNPNRFDEDSPYTYLAAVGVSFLVLVAVNRTLDTAGYFTGRQRPDLLSLLDIVALGTVCDVVPLVGLNRAFVAQGIKVMAQRRNTGLKALADVARVDEKPSAYHLGFMLGPRVNAGGRVGRSELGSLLLSTDDPDTAAQIARELDQFNQERKAIEDQVLEEAIAQADQQGGAATVVWGHGWHPGVIGIVAGRLKERYNRPACVIGLDDKGVGKGSGRSIPGIHLGNLVIAARQQGLLLAGGGHGMAAGFTVAEPDIEPFRDYLNEKVAHSVAMQGLKPTLALDAAIPVSAATPSLVKQLELLGPFGAGNPQPRFLFRDVRVVDAGVVGNAHVRCVLSPLHGPGRLKAISFRSLETELGQALLMSRGKTIHVAGTLKTDSWNGNEQAQLFIDDMAMAAEHQLAIAGAA